MRTISCPLLAEWLSCGRELPSSTCALACGFPQAARSSGPICLTPSRLRLTKAERARLLAAVGITPAEAALFQVIQYGITDPPEYLPRRALNYAFHDSATLAESQAALDACLAKGWLQVIDERALAEIQTTLRADGCLGPVYGLPDLGGVDFTAAGAERWLHFNAYSDFGYSPRPFSYTDVVHSQTAHYFTSHAGAADYLEKYVDPETTTIHGPVAIGPWRADWWLTFREGVRVDLDVRSQWELARHDDSDNSLPPCIGNGPRGRADLQDALDRRHMTRAQWHLLNLVRTDPVQEIVSRASRTSRRKLGVELSDEECLNALEGCLRNGWIRQLDRAAIAEIQASLRLEPAETPLPLDFAARLGGLDYTPVGAGLYWSIVTEVNGPDWLATFSLTHEYYREEHRYCESRGGCTSGVFGGLATAGKAVRSEQCPRIGPWCAHWSEKFPSGYRLELQLGDPSVWPGVAMSYGS